MRNQPGQLLDFLVGGERQDEAGAADSLEFNDFCDPDLAYIPMHPAFPYPTEPVARYRAQSTITVPILSPFSTARWACAVSDSGNWPAILWTPVPAASHREMSSCAAAS